MRKIFEPTDHLTVDNIQRYLRKEMNSKEQFRVENHLLDCALCDDAVEGYANTYTASDPAPALATLDLRITQRLEKTAPIVKDLSPHRNRWLYRAAAVGALLIASLAALLYWQNSSESRLYSQHYVPLEAGEYGVKRSNSAEVSPNFEKAFYYYGTENYTSAIAFFEDHLAAYPDDATAQLYAGVSYLQQNTLPKAINHLKAARVNSKKHFTKATWYLALAYLKAGEKTKAQRLLTELQNSEDLHYKGRAGEMLGKLK